MGSWLADDRFGRQCGVHERTPARTRDGRLRGHFAPEARVASCLSHPSMHKMKERLADLASSDQLVLPFPGSGKTAQRLAALQEFGRHDLGLARLIEALTDFALRDRSESAGRTARSGPDLDGVWASDGPSSLLTLSKGDDGTLRLNGTKRYCTGAPFLDAALVTARVGEDATSDRRCHFNANGLMVDASEWARRRRSARPSTATVVFDIVRCPAMTSLGGAWLVPDPSWLLARCSRTCCLLGGRRRRARGRAARDLKRGDPHSRAQLGALEAADWGLRALLDQAGREIDADPQDVAMRGATKGFDGAGHLLERMCTDVLDRLGARPARNCLAFDARVAHSDTAAS